VPGCSGPSASTHACRGRSLVIIEWFTWKRTLVIAIVAAEIAVLSLVAWSAHSAPADGVAVSADQAGLKVSDQTGVTATITIDWLRAPGPSWLVVRAGSDAAAPGAILGMQHVDAGEFTNVPVSIEATMLPHSAVAVLVADLGTPGVLEYGGQMSSGGVGVTATKASADKPYIADGMVVNYPFAIAPLTTNVGSMDATISPLTWDASGSSVVANYVKAIGQSWLAVSVVTTSGPPGEIVGVTLVPRGLSRMVTVPIQAAARGRRLVATLHADLGKPNQFEYSTTDLGNSSDQPYVAGGQTVQVPVPHAP